MGFLRPSADYRYEMAERVCAGCGSKDLLTIVIAVEGDKLSFTACHGCEATWWLRGDERMELGSVIDLVATK